MKSYLERQNECGIKVGDKVKVIRKSEDYEDGWENTWETVMDDAVGNEYEVIGVHGINGITINFDLGLNFPYFVLSKVVEKPEPSPQPTDGDFKGYNTDDIDNWFKESIELHQAELEAKRAYDQWMATIKPDNPKPASGYTATLAFDLTTEDGGEAWHIHKQAVELHSFAFEVLYNLTRDFERAYDADPEASPVDILSSLIAELAENYNLNVN